MPRRLPSTRLVAATVGGGGSYLRLVDAHESETRCALAAPAIGPDIEGPTNLLARASRVAHVYGCRRTPVGRRRVHKAKYVGDTAGRSLPSNSPEQRLVVRLWWEVSTTVLHLDVCPYPDAKAELAANWFPFNKGGTFDGVVRQSRVRDQLEGGATGSLHQAPHYDRRRTGVLLPRSLSWPVGRRSCGSRVSHATSAYRTRADSRWI